MNYFLDLRDTIKRLSPGIIVLALMASIIGIIFITSATSRWDNAFKFPLVQSVALLIGLFAMLLVVILEYEYIAKLWFILSGACMILLILVLRYGIGGESTGTVGWFSFGVLSFQPAEVAKLAFILSFAKHIDLVGDDINKPQNVLLLIVHMALPIGLVLLQPDFGTAVVYMIVFASMLLFSGLHWLYIAGGGIAGVGLALFAWANFLNNIQKARIVTFLSRDLATEAQKWHVEQSLIAIGSGRVFGKGLFNGSQIQSGMVPSAHADFIFATIGEEGGIIWCVVVIVIMFLIIGSAYGIAMNAKNKLGLLIGVGIATMWLFHTYENIGMTMELMPITGIPLPFISYGGSFIVTNFIALGLLLSIEMRPRTINF